MALNDSQSLHFRVVADAGANCAVTLSRLDSNGGRFDDRTGEFTIGSIPTGGSSSISVRATSCNGRTSTAVIPFDGQESSPYTVNAVESFDFSPAPVGPTNGYVVVSLVNRTALPLPVTRGCPSPPVRTSGSKAWPGCRSFLRQDRKLAIRVTFEPAHEGSLTDTILVATSDPNAPSVKITVSGQAVN